MSSAGPGCIRVLKEAFGPTGLLLSPVAQFTFVLDNAVTAANDSNGVAVFYDVPPGSHIVTENVPGGWSLINATPSGGIVTVLPGTACTGVNFKNQQLYTPPSSAPPPPHYEPPRYDYPPVYVTERPIYYDTAVCRPSDLSIQKTSDRFEAQPGDVVSYAVTVRNSGSQTIENVEIEDRTEGGQAIVIDGGGGNRIATTLRWKIGELRGGESRSVTYRARLGMDVHHGDSVINRARVLSSCGDAETMSTIRIIEQLPQTGFFDSKNPFLTRIKKGSLFARNDSAAGTATMSASIIAIASSAIGLLLRRRRVL